MLPLEAGLEIATTEEVVEKEDAMDLKEAIEKLPADERVLIVLRFFEEKKLEEIAEICGEALSTIKSRVYRTLKKLRLELDMTE